jgi:hypothetical protein
MPKLSTIPSVDRFFREFVRLTPEESAQAIAECEDFCRGYREGKADAESEVWQDSDGVPQVLGEVSGATLAETMNYLGVRLRGRAS